MATPRKSDIIKFINRKYGRNLQKVWTGDFASKAVNLYREIASKLAGAETSLTDIMNKDKNSRKLLDQLGPEHVGKMVMYYYDPKLKNELPYFDRCPLVIPTSIQSDGWTGINFHYLHPLLRAQLLDMLLSNQAYDFMAGDPRDIKWGQFNRRQIAFTYRTLQAICSSNLYKPCIKRYLYNHRRSRFYVLAPDDWIKFIALPLERFEKRTAAFVWDESAKKIYGTP